MATAEPAAADADTKPKPRKQLRWSGTAACISYPRASWTFVIPNSLPLVGITVAVQGFDFAPIGPCFGQIRASSTIDVTVR